jgi:hypothetical protein
LVSDDFPLAYSLFDHADTLAAGVADYLAVTVTV